MHVGSVAHAIFSAQAEMSAGHAAKHSRINAFLLPVKKDVTFILQVSLEATACSLTADLQMDRGTSHTQPLNDPGLECIRSLARAISNYRVAMLGLAAPAEVMYLNDTQVHVTVYDIGQYVGKEGPSDYTLDKWLEEHLYPPPNYAFPLSKHRKDGKNRNMLSSSMITSTSYQWLVISDTRKGLFCTYCPFFVNHAEGEYQQNMPLGNLLAGLLFHFAKLLGKDSALEMHQKSKYHRGEVEAGDAFLSEYHQQSEDVSNKVETAKLQQIHENHVRLARIISCVIFLRQRDLICRAPRL